jgi:hypothetical protein
LGEGHEGLFHLHVTSQGGSSKTASVELRTPVVGLKVTPVGSVSVMLSLNIGAGTPLAVTMKLPAEPTVKIVLEALVKAGAELTVKVKVWVA